MSPELQQQYLIDAIQGDHKAAETLFYFLHGRILPFCIKHFKDRATAEDIANESIYRLFEFAQPETIRNPLNLAFETARNRIKDGYRRQNVRQEYANRHQKTFNNHYESDAEINVDITIIDDVIKQKLNDNEQQLWNIHLEGYKNPEIAEKLNLPVSIVGKHKFRIREKIKKWVKILRGPRIS